MKPYLILSLIALSILSLACTKKDSNHEIDVTSYKTIDITDYEKYEVEKLPFKDVKYIYLQSSEDFLIGRVTDLLICNDKIFVFDKRYSKTLFVFDTAGHFLNKIGREGKGPTEYVSLNDFDVDDLGNIYLHDQASKKILKYQSDGLFLRSYTYDFFSSQIGCLGNDIFFLDRGVHAGYEKLKDNDDNTCIIWSGSTNKIVNSYFPYQGQNVQAYGGAFRIYRSGKNINYIPVHQDDVYEISDEGVRKKFRIILDQKRLAKEEINNYAPDKVAEYYRNSELFEVSNLFENDDFITFSLNRFRFGKQYNCVVNKENGHKIVAEKMQKTKKVQPDFLGQVDPKAVYGEYFISVIEGWALEAYIEQAKTNNKFFMERFGHLSVVDSLKKMPSMSNPIICMFILNEF